MGGYFVFNTTASADSMKTVATEVRAVPTPGPLAVTETEPSISDAQKILLEKAGLIEVYQKRYLKDVLPIFFDKIKLVTMNFSFEDRLDSISYFYDNDTDKDIKLAIYIEFSEDVEEETVQEIADFLVDRQKGLMHQNIAMDYVTPSFGTKSFYPAKITPKP